MLKLFGNFNLQWFFDILLKWKIVEKVDAVIIDIVNGGGKSKCGMKRVLKWRHGPGKESEKCILKYMKYVDWNCKEVIFWVMLIEVFWVCRGFVYNAEHEILKNIV